MFQTCFFGRSSSVLKSPLGDGTILLRQFTYLLYCFLILSITNTNSNFCIFIVGIAFNGDSIDFITIRIGILVRFS